MPTSCSGGTGQETSRCSDRWERDTAFGSRRSIRFATKSSSSAALASRRLIGEGKVDEAGALLGHHYAIDGEVVEGAQRGQTQGFPTANLRTENEIVPPNGVYATTVTLDRVIHPAVTNIGVRPTFETNGHRVVEAHLLDYDADLYGRRVRLAFVQRLRDEQAFPDARTLQRQIASDCEEARALFDRISL